MLKTRHTEALLRGTFLVLETDFPEFKTVARKETDLERERTVGFGMFGEEFVNFGLDNRSIAAVILVCERREFGLHLLSGFPLEFSFEIELFDFSLEMCDEIEQMETIDCTN